MFSGQKGDSFVIQSFRVKLLNYLVQDTLGPLDPEYKGTPGNNHPSTQPHISVEMSLKYLAVTASNVARLRLFLRFIKNSTTQALCLFDWRSKKPVTNRYNCAAPSLACL